MSADERVTAARADLAAAELEGVELAARYVAARPKRVLAPNATVRAAPDPGAECVDELLFGEAFSVIEEADGFAWGQARRDGYVGFVAAEALGTAERRPTHRIAARSTFALAEPKVRAAAFGPLSMNALVAIEAEEAGFARAADAGWIALAHLAPIGRYETDPASVAQAFLGAPYLWGGRDARGLDCSGLVHQALSACGVGAPRDADQQAALGRPVGRDSLARGDLVCWKGHIGLMLDGERLIHANAHHMAVAIEPLSRAEARIAAAGAGPPTAFRRLDLIGRRIPMARGTGSTQP